MLALLIIIIILGAIAGGKSFGSVITSGLGCFGILLLLLLFILSLAGIHL